MPYVICNRQGNYWTGFNFTPGLRNADVYTVRSHAEARAKLLTLQGANVHVKEVNVAG